MGRRLVVDTNKIVAALMKRGTARRELLLPGLEFYAPKHALGEVEEHRREITEKVDE